MLPATAENERMQMLTDRAQRILDRARQTTDPVQALELLTHLMEGKITVVCTPTIFSRKTGKPIQFEWKTVEKWDGALLISNWDDGITINNECPAFAPIMKYLKGRKARLIENRKTSKKFAVSLVGYTSPGLPGPGNDGDYYSEHIQFSELE